MANKVLEIKTQTNERITLLGDKNPDHTENNYQDKLTQIRQQLENATKMYMMILPTYMPKSNH